MRNLITMKVFSLAIIIAIALFAVSHKVEGGIKTEQAIIEEPSSSHDPVSEWNIYRNDKWGYSVEYPPDWTARITLENDATKPEYVIKEEVTFSSSGYGQITLHVWTNQSKFSLCQWFEKNKQWFVGGEAEISKCTATGLELQAICVREPRTPQAYEALKCFFQKNNRVYQLMYNNSDESQSEGIYGHMLATFAFE